MHRYTWVIYKLIQKNFILEALEQIYNHKEIKYFLPFSLFSFYLDFLGTNIHITDDVNPAMGLKKTKK